MTTDERYAFPSLPEGLIKGLGALATPELIAKVKAVGLDVHKLPPAIPASVMSAAIGVMAREAFPDQPEDEAHRRVGLMFIQGWRQTLLGSAATAMLKLVGPRRALLRIDRAFRTSDNFTTGLTTMRGEKEAAVVINDVNGPPSYWLGLFEAALEVMGLRGTVTLESQHGVSATFVLRWE